MEREVLFSLIFDIGLICFGLVNLYGIEKNSNGMKSDQYQNEEKATHLKTVMNGSFDGY